jgi:uncharacterized protein (DUF885 family)
MARNDTSDRGVRAPLRALLAGLAIAALASGCVTVPHGTDNPRAIRVLADDYLAAMLERNPELITTYGLQGRHDRLTDNSLAALAAWEHQEDTFLARLSAIAPPAPGAPEWAVYGILRETLEASRDVRITSALERAARGWRRRCPTSPRSSPSTRRTGSRRSPRAAADISTEVASLRGATSRCPARQRGS